MSEGLPKGLEAFLDEAGWAGAAIEPLPGDASFRRYFRVSRAEERALVMEAPPPNEDPRPFLAVGGWLAAQGLRAPAIHAARPDEGWVLLEDFGHDRMRDWLDANPGAEEETYRRAVETLVALHRCPPGPFAAYDMDVYLREALLFTQWFCPAAGIAADEARFAAAWEDVLGPLLDRQRPGVTVLRDYHAENIMLLPGGEQGLIDFQDALVGHPAYDLVSLLQDARRDVSQELEAAMLAHYCALAGCGAEFAADYARLGAQRNAKIVGIFARLWRRDGKPRYLAMIPRVWEALERDLAHPALAPVAAWFRETVPDPWRQRQGRLEP